MKIKYYNLALILILLISFIIRFSYVEKLPNNDDAIFYHKAAIDLSNFSKPIVLINKIPYPTMVILGYPFILSIFYKIFSNSYLTGEVVTIMFGLVALLFVYLITKRLFNEKAGLIACILLAFSPLHLILTTTILTDVPSLCLMLIAMYVYINCNWKYKNQFFGFLSGINLFVRPSSSILLLIPLFDNVINKRKLLKNYGKIALFFAPFIFLFFVINYNLYGNALTDGYHYYKEKLNFVVFDDITSPIPKFTGESLQEKLGGLLFYIYSFIHGGNLIDSFAATFVTFSAIIIFLTILLLLSLKYTNFKTKNEIMLIFILAILNLIFYSFQRYYGVRYMIVTYSLFVILASGELEYLSRIIIPKNKIRLIAVLGSILLIIIPAYISALPYLSFFHNTQLPIINTVKWIDKNTEKNAVIISDYFLQFNYHSNKSVVPIRILDETSFDELIKSNTNVYFVEDFYTTMQPTKCFNENAIPNNITLTRIRTRKCKAYGVIDRYPTSKMVFEYVINNYNVRKYDTPFGFSYYKIINKSSRP